MLKLALIRTAAVVLGVPGILAACSTLALVKDGRVLFGANADRDYINDLKLRATPARDGLFGRVCISHEIIPGWSPNGSMCMNDQGVAVSWANTPRGNNPHDPDKPQFRHNFVEKILSESASVKQAVALAAAHVFPADLEDGLHIMFVDKSGDVAVVEWVSGETKIIRRDGPALLMTNSLLSRPETAGGPNSRYNRGLRMLPQLKDASVDSVFSVMKEISIGAVIKGQEVGTLTSGVWDVTRGELHLVYKRDYDHPRVFNLDQELAKGEHSIPLVELFPNPVPFETAWRDENGPVVRKAAGK